MKKMFLHMPIMLFMLAILASACIQKEKSNGPIFSTAPEGAIVLFDGTDLSKWTNSGTGEIKWKIVDGVLETVPDSARIPMRGIMTKQLFRDFQMHLEFKLPDNENTNSGVYIQKRYELQILYTPVNEIDPGMGGSLYRQKLPDVNVGKPKGEWQTYDIVFRAARFDPSDPEKKVENARITVLQNNVVIHNNAIITSKTGLGESEGIEPAPIVLQDHLAHVKFRNIWVIPNVPVETLPENAN